MKYFFILLILLSFITFANNSFAQCVQNTDWPKAPCFDEMPVNREEYRKAWAPYHDYKGQEWMESKKSEMFEAQKNGTLDDWMDKSHANFNVFSYYHSLGQISFPSKYNYFFFEDEAIWHQNELLIPFGIIVSIVIGASTVIVFRRRK